MIFRTFRSLVLASVWAVALTSIGASVQAQQPYLERPGASLGQATEPGDRVTGGPGEMQVAKGSCKSLPLATSRRRVVDLAAQEWAYFGFSVTDRTQARSRSRIARGRWWRSQAASRARSEAFARVAPSIAGYWAATPGAAWALERQNAIWKQSGAQVSRWRDPWSAAFVSWVMCEAGIGQPDQFQRSIAHRAYIDQAIRARDGRAPASAFVAYDMGEKAIEPGDLLCSGTRSGYRSIDQRRKQMGKGARTHCDIVVAVEDRAGVILAIGGNVYGTVSLKRLPAVREQGPKLHPRDDIFAHLSLRASSIGQEALFTSPTARARAEIRAITQGSAPPSPTLNGKRD